MESILKSIEVHVPVKTAYNQWTQFEEFPHFMEGVKEVKQLDEKNLRWRANLFGNEQEWTAEITEQHPDHRVAWHSTSGADNAGVVTFHYIDDNITRVTLQLDYDAKGFIETIGDALGFVSRRVEGDLKRFKEFIEKRQMETGAWRGTIENPKVAHG